MARIRQKLETLRGKGASFACRRHRFKMTDARSVILSEIGAIDPKHFYYRAPVMNYSFLIWGRKRRGERLTCDNIGLPCTCVVSAVLSRRIHTRAAESRGYRGSAVPTIRPIPTLACGRSGRRLARRPIRRMRYPESFGPTRSAGTAALSRRLIVSAVMLNLARAQIACCNVTG